MTTTATSLKLPAALKRRVDRLARHTHRTPHAEMVAAIAEHVAQAERRQAFVADALAAEQEVADRGTAFLLEDVEAPLLALARGEKSRRPRARAWPR